MSPERAADAYELISLALLDPPRQAIRETLDESALEELARSIRDVGVIEPLIVAARDGRYEIIAGHRRFLAAQIARLIEVPCIVRAAGEVAGEALTVHENVHREDLNAAEEARYFTRLCDEQCGGDTDRLAMLVREKRDYVESRLALLHGDADVLGALADRKISFAVARELNRITDAGYRRVALESAIRTGASARLISDWRTRWNAETPLAQEPTSPAGGPPTETAPARAPQFLVCFLCEDGANPYDLEVMHVHRVCRRLILDRALDAYFAERRAAGTAEPKA